jgi:hypothetical protein
MYRYTYKNIQFIKSNLNIKPAEKDFITYIRKYIQMLKMKNVSTFILTNNPEQYLEGSEKQRYSEKLSINKSRLTVIDINKLDTLNLDYLKDELGEEDAITLILDSEEIPSKIRNNFFELLTTTFVLTITLTKEETNV